MGTAGRMKTRTRLLVAHAGSRARQSNAVFYCRERCITRAATSRSAESPDGDRPLPVPKTSSAFVQTVNRRPVRLGAVHSDEHGAAAAGGAYG